MADPSLNYYVARGTAAEMAAYTPSPPVPVGGPDPGYFFYQTDTGGMYSWSGAAWVGVVGSGTVTHTGTLTANRLIKGNGGTDITVGDLSGDVTTSATMATTIANDAVSNAKLADMAALTTKVRAANSSGDPSDLALSDGQTAKRVGTAVSSASFGPVSMSVLTTGTAATYTVPAGIYRLKVRVSGAGGQGGGGDQAAAQSGAGGGGGAGGYAEKIISTTPAATFTYTIGVGGSTSGTGNTTGQAGTATTWDSGGSPVVGNGGGGGGSMASGTGLAAATGGAGGTATGGSINITGQEGTQAIRTANNVFWAGVGGSNLLGVGGAAQSSGTGLTATGYGGGGAGGSNFSSTADVAGGVGASGVIIVDEYQ